MFILITSTILIIIVEGLIFALLYQKKQRDILSVKEENERLVFKNEDLSAQISANSENLIVKDQILFNVSMQKGKLEEQISFFLKERVDTKGRFEFERSEKDRLNLLVIKMQERLSSQEKLESDLRLLLEKAKDEITIQNRVQYQAIHDQLRKYTEEKGKEFHKEAEESFEKIIQKDVRDTIVKLHEALNLQQEKLKTFEKPVDYFIKILSGSKESGLHGEQTIINQLELMGLRFGIDYFTQVTSKSSNEEKLVADVVILVPNSGMKDVLIIDAKSSTKLGGSESEFMQSIESSFNNFARKDYKSAIERRLKEDLKDLEINQTHVFMYLPFDKMLSKISEEKTEFLSKMRDKNIGILTPTILTFLLDSIKLYSAKLEMNVEIKSIMGDVKVLIERTVKVIEFIKDLGKSVDQTSKKYFQLKSSVTRMFMPAVNRMAKPLNIKAIQFEDFNEDNLKEIEEIK